MAFTFQKDRKQNKFLKEDNDALVQNSLIYLFGIILYLL